MNVAVIGAGGMGTLHARCATQCGMKVVACGDVIKAKAEALASQYGAAVSDDCPALLRRNDVDIVAVCTPTPQHTPYVIAAAQAGKHVFCEKPFGRSLRQCEDAMAAVEKAGVKLYIGHVVRFFQEFEAIRAQIEAGKVGRVGFVKTYRGGIFPKGEKFWFSDYAQSGGVTFDTIIHDFDWLRYAFGEPDRVYCQNLRRMMPQFIDYSLVTFRMKSGVMANAVGTWAHPGGFRVKVEVCGDKGMLLFDSNDAPLSSMMRTEAGGQPGMIVPGSPVPVSPYQLEWEDFAAWLKGAKPRVTPADGLAAVRMGLAALESAETGQPVRL